MHYSTLDDCQRTNKTSFSLRRHRKKRSNSKQNLFIMTDRPFTTSLGRTQQIGTYRKIQMAESELSQTFHGQMNSYIRKKIKSLTAKNNETLVVEEDNLQKTIQNPEQTQRWSLNKPRNVQQMNFCSLVHSGGKKKVQKVLGEPYFITTKQKLTRLLSLKKDKDKEDCIFKEKVILKKNQKQRLRRKRDSLFKDPLPIQNFEWDNEWRQDIVKQKNRYRKRLTKKHIRNSQMTIQW